MKMLHYVPALLIAASVGVGCNDEKKDTAVTTTDTVTTTTPAPTTTVRYAGDGNRTVITKAETPPVVVTSFETKYPKAQKVEWVRYDPIPEDNWNIEKDYYYITYEVDGVPYGAWYDPEGTWIRTSTPFKDIAGLPAAVSKAIADGFPGYEVVEVDKENDKNTDMYEVEMKKGEAKAKVKFLPNGDIFKAKTN